MTQHQGGLSVDSPSCAGIIRTTGFMKKFLTILLTATLAYQSYAQPALTKAVQGAAKILSTSARTAEQQESAFVRAASTASQDSSAVQTQAKPATVLLETSSKGRLAKEAVYTPLSVGNRGNLSEAAWHQLNVDNFKNSRAAAEKLEKEKSSIQKAYEALVKKVEALRTKDSKYRAPWALEANRVDWKARDLIKAGGKPLTPDEIAKQMKTTPDVVKAMLAKDQANSRKVFFKMSDGRIWVSSEKLP